jgi:hypothetical protein
LHKARSFDLPLFNFAAAETEASFTDYPPGIFFPSGSPVCSKTMLNFSVQDSEKASNNKLSFASTSTLSDGGSGDPDDLIPVQLRTFIASASVCAEGQSYTKGSKAQVELGVAPMTPTKAGE